nr:betaine--homocysteine S-methyltransferase 1-like [Paramormyrops kingsleyae]
MPPVKKGILERLNAGEVVIGDGGFVFALEKRGYVKAGPWTPEASVTHPEAVRQLHREFLRSGSNVMQTFTFYASDDKLENRGNDLRLSGQQINEAACDLAREVANEGDALVAGGVSQTPSYLSCKSEAEVKDTFKKQMDVFIRKNVDFLIAEYFEHVEEAEWAKHGMWGSGLDMHTKPWVRARSRREYWEQLQPASGRPTCPSMSRPEGWGVTKGHADLIQHREVTSKQEMQHLLEMQKKAKASA